MIGTLTFFVLFAARRPKSIEIEAEIEAEIERRSVTLSKAEK